MVVALPQRVASRGWGSLPAGSGLALGERSCLDRPRPLGPTA